MRTIMTKVASFITVETFDIAFEFIDIHQSASTRSHSMPGSFCFDRGMDIGNKSVGDAKVGGIG